MGQQCREKGGKGHRIAVHSGHSKVSLDKTYFLFKQSLGCTKSMETREFEVKIF